MAQEKESSAGEQTHIVETKAGVVKITQPKGHHHKGVTVLFNTDDVVRDQVGGFTNFLREYAVVGLAVGFIIGQQANAVVKQLVASFVDPLVKMWFGHDLSDQVAIVHHDHSPVQIPWGLFVYTLLEFFLVAVVVYLLIKLFRLDKLRKVEATPIDTTAKK